MKCITQWTYGIPTWSNYYIIKILTFFFKQICSYVVRYRTHSCCPYISAILFGVSPYLFFLSIGISAAYNARSACNLPLSAAKCAGVHDSSNVRAHPSAPTSISRRIHSAYPVEEFAKTYSVLFHLLPTYCIMHNYKTYYLSKNLIGFQRALRVFYLQWLNSHGGVLNSVLASSGAQSPVDQSNDYNIGICCFPAEHVTFRNQSNFRLIG